MHKYRWDREPTNVVTVSAQHRMLSSSHAHYVPLPPTEIHYLCRPPSTFAGNAKVTYIETCTKPTQPIGDVYFFENPLGQAKMHPFAHYKRTSVYPKQGLKFCTGILSSPPHCYTAYTDATVLTSSGFGPAEYPTTGLQSIYVNTRDGDFAPPPKYLDNYIQRSLECMLPGIKPTMSLPNSLLELKDFKSLGKTLGNLAYFMGQTAKTFAKLPKKWTIKKLLATAADSHLQGSFNIMPLLGDIAAVQRTMRETEKELAQLIARQHMVQKRHFNASMHDSYQDSDSGWLSGTKSVPSGHPPIYGNAKCRRITNYGTRLFHAEIWYSYWLGTAEIEQARIRAYLDKLGVNLNPAIIWNAIPWSFVVDWFVGIGPWLSQFTSRNIEPIVIIHRFLYSYKVGRSIYLSGKIEPIDNHHGGAETLQAWHEETLYKRVVGMPDIYRAIQTSGLNPKEFLLGASLAYLRWTRNSL